MAGRTQNALYAEIDLELSWSEDQLPQFERTKHVHALHPYLGKFVPQLVETFLRRFFKPGDWIFDPFVGSGTTLVEANAYGANAIGSDISAFNCLLSRVKTTQYSLGSLEMALRVALEEARQAAPVETSGATPWLSSWFSPRALGELIAYQRASEKLDDPAWDVARIILSRSARSARLTTHYDLDFPRTPVRGEYYCHKHKRTCRPVDEAAKFLQRYTIDTIRRLRAFADVQSSATIEVLHEDSRFVRLPEPVTGVITSPPYPGLIDYHEQHRYAYELLGLKDRRQDELGAAAKGNSRSATGEYADGMVEVLRNAVEQLDGGGPLVIVVNDSRNLYPEILSRSGLLLVERLTRHVNRRTGRRSGEYYEDVLVCAPKR
jgi:DNA modification methylase